MPVPELLLSVGIPAIQSIVTSKVIPAIEEAIKRVKKSYDLNVTPLATHFEGYLKRAYEKNSILNTLVFRNSQKQLRDLYLPLSLVPDGVDKPAKEEMVMIDSYPQEFVSQYRRILIMDTAGMGKSTLSKIMFLSAIDGENGIPFYIELRRLSKKHRLLDEIRDQLDSLTKEFDDDLMRSLFQSGGFIFFFDGYDEIGLSDRKEVTEDIRRFIDKAPDNYFILTSRYEQSLVGFGDFRAMRILPLSKEDAFCLLRKYDSNGETSKRLIEKLEAGDYRKMSDFLQNPLLVSLLFIGFEYKPEIPLKTHLFYNQVFEAYFNNHDLSKDGYYTHEKLSQLDIADFGKVLRAIGYICLITHKLEFDRNDFMELLERAGKLSCISFTSTDALMNDLLHAVPLFCQDGVNYKWVHKSMQEYFAAEFIYRDSGEKKNQILKSIYQSSNIANYMNLLELFSDIDSYSFSQVFVLPVLDDFISYVDSSIDSKNVEKESLIRSRRELIYGRDTYMYVFTKEESKIPFPDIFDYLRSKVDVPVTRSVISHSSNKIYRGIMYISDNRGYLVELIIKKYPKIIGSHFGSGRGEIKGIQSGEVYHCTEDNLIDYPDIYNEVNALMYQLAFPSMSYLNAKTERERIIQTQRETEKTLNDLLAL